MNRKSSTLAAAAFAALLLSGQAAAQNSGWYIGGGPGSTKAKFWGLNIHESHSYLLGGNNSIPVNHSFNRRFDNRWIA